MRRMDGRKVLDAICRKSRRRINVREKNSGGVNVDLRGENDMARQEPLLGGAHEGRQGRGGGLCARRREVKGQRLTAPPQARRVNLIAGH